MFGREDIDEIAPAIADARAEGIGASRPWPGDTVFMRARRGEFDIVVAQYHDQGLMPVKYLGIERGVNVTVGLPFIRTSVDHGTAFDIAGTGRADPPALRYAFEQAVRLAEAGCLSPRISEAMADPDFIFMLTRNDRTIPDAMERLSEVVAAGVTHIGFKDVGLPFEQLEQLAAKIKTAGARLYLEVVFRKSPIAIVSRRSNGPRSTITMRESGRAAAVSLPTNTASWVNGARTSIRQRISCAG